MWEPLGSALGAVPPLTPAPLRLDPWGVARWVPTVDPCESPLQPGLSPLADEGPGHSPGGPGM